MISESVPNKDSRYRSEEYRGTPTELLSLAKRTWLGHGNGYDVQWAEFPKGQARLVFTSTYVSPAQPGTPIPGKWVVTA